MGAGNMNCRITIQHKTKVQDSELNWTETWVDWKTVWAEPLDETSREVYRLNSENPEVTRAFRIYYMAGVTPYQRIRFKVTRFYEIIGWPTNESERNATLLISCKGVV